MKKMGMVLGVAVVATLAGCKDPNYVRHSDRVQNKAMPVATTPAKPIESKPATPAIAVTDVKAEPKVCTCAPGARHEKPCACGAANCACVVEAPKPAAPETTPYIVQRGDYLAKISKKYNVTIAAILKVNPQIKNNIVKVGQTIQIPGKVEVGEQTVPQGAFAAPAKKPAKAATEYKGETKEYVVKSGDTLGAIAYGNGINIRQLKQMNGLTGNPILKVGQKLKVPAEAPKAAEKKAEAKPAEAAKAEAAKPAEKVEAAKPAEEAKNVEPAAPVAEEAKKAESAPAEAVAPATTPAPEAPVADAAEEVKTITHVIKEGEDMTRISLVYGVTAAQVRELNNLAEGEQLKPGQVIKLPADAQPQP